MRTKKWTIIGLSSLGVLLFVAGVLFWLAPEAPVAQMTAAREALAKAKKSRADVFASALFLEAELFYDSAMVAWASQNGRFLFNRNYDTVVSWSTKATEKANAAVEHSVRYEEAKSRELLFGLEDLERKIEFYERVYRNMPLPKSIMKTHANGKMKVAEACIAFNAGRLIDAAEYGDVASGLISRSSAEADGVIREWFRHYAQWKKQGEEAIRLSKRNKVVVIDKYAHLCLVYQKGVVVQQFRVELGVNWIGDKRTKGDKTTPEGVYQIVKKKGLGQTRFHRALLINYPNELDRKRIAAEKKHGTISKHAELGSLIEIHGHGGKGVDWTDGCVALSNHDMDRLYQLTDVGTRVVIVGSMNPLEHIYNQSRHKP